MNSASEILEHTKSILNGDRNTTHGNYKECFGMICLFWTLYLQTKKKVSISIDEEDMAMMMILVKIVRQMIGKGDIDNFLDICGYSAFAGEFFGENNY